MHQKTHRILTVLTIILMLLFTGSLAYAAENTEKIQLTMENVAEWPEIKGEMFFGQTLAEGNITIEGGKVTIDGTAEGEVVAGTFEFVDTTIRPIIDSEDKAQLKFVPADEEVYIGFEALDTQVAIPVSATTPIYTALPVATKVAQVNDKLNTSTLSMDGVFINPYTGEEIADGKWAWLTSGRTKISSPGLFQAVSCFSTIYYVQDIVDVWVGIEGVDDSKMPTFVEQPTFTETIRLNPDKTWGDYTLTGGKAVVYDADNNEIEVEGTFTVADVYKNAPINKLGENSVVIQFTSADESLASSIPFAIKVNVEKKLPTWTSGEKLELTYDYGMSPFNTHGGQIKELDATNLNCYVEGTNQWQYNFSVYDLDKNPLTLTASDILDVGEYEYLVTVSHSAINANWDTTAFLPVKIIIKAGKAAMDKFSYNYTTGEVKGNYNNTYLNGIVDITMGETTIEDVPVTQGRFTANWNPADISVGAAYPVKVVYTKADGDNAEVDNDYETTVKFKANRAIAVGEKGVAIEIGNKSYNPDPNSSWGTHNVYAGDEVTVRARMNDFVYWTIKDADGNKIDLAFIEGDENTSKFVFIMPAGNIQIDYTCQYELDAIQAKEDAIANCKCLCHSDNQFVRFFWRIICIFIDMIEQLTGKEILCECGYSHCA